MIHSELAPTGKCGHRSDGWWARSRTFDLEAFKKPTPEQAYYLGYLLGDGSFNGSQVQLASIDRESPCGLARAIGLSADAVKSYRQKNGKRFWVVRFSNPGLGPLLEPWGIVPRKTYRFRDPFVPRNLLESYLRGLFDADGHYYFSEKYQSFRMGLSGNSGVCRFWMSSVRALGYKGTFGVQKRKETYSEVSIRGRRQVVAAYLLLNGFPRLERKWAKIEATAIRE